MPTNLDLDDKLIRQAVRLGKHKSKKEAVTVALQQYVNSHRRPAILDSFGKIDFWPDFDHKELRKRKATR